MQNALQLSLLCYYSIFFGWCKGGNCGEQGTGCRGFRDQGSRIRGGSEFRVQSSAPPVGGGVLDAPRGSTTDEATGNRQQATGGEGTAPSAPLRCAQDDEYGALSARRDGSQPSTLWRQGIGKRGRGGAALHRAGLGRDGGAHRPHEPRLLRRLQPRSHYRRRKAEALPPFPGGISPAGAPGGRPAGGDPGRRRAKARPSPAP